LPRSSLLLLVLGWCCGRPAEVGATVSMPVVRAGVIVDLVAERVLH
jgi:hypothetical protein